MSPTSPVNPTNPANPTSPVNRMSPTSRTAPTPPESPTPPAATATAHLTPALCARATRHLIRKALAEFAHERLLHPVREGRRHTVHSDDGATAYRFTATRLTLDHWHIDPASITRHRTADGTELPLDALAFFTELRSTLALADRVLPVYLEEITATLSSLAFKYARADAQSATALTHAGFQTIEAAMTEGHPCFVANSGRLGFGAHDLPAYAPEAAAPVRLTWLAARRDRATFTAGEGLAYDTFAAGELDPATATGSPPYCERGAWTRPTTC
jgi:siderophore synthetase component